MRKWSLLTATLILLMACTCQVPSFLSDLLPGRGEARGEMIEYDTVVEGTVGIEGLQYWSFSGRPGDQIMISMESQDFDTYLALFGPADDYLVADDDGAGDLNAMIRRFVLFNSGIYNIVATSYGGEETGDYTLELKRTDTGRDADEAAGGTITSGGSVSGELQNSTGDAWQYFGAAGELVTIRLESDEFDTVLEIWGPDLAGITGDDDGGGDSNSLIDSFLLPTTGTYNIVVRGYGRGDRGAYTLSVD